MHALCTIWSSVLIKISLLFIKKKQYKIAQKQKRNERLAIDLRLVGSTISPLSTRISILNWEIQNSIFQHFLSNQTNSESETQNSLKLLGQNSLSNWNVKLKIQNQKNNSQAKLKTQKTNNQANSKLKFMRERERVPEKCEETDWLVNPWKCGQRICENVENKREREREYQKNFSK